MKYRIKIKNPIYGIPLTSIGKLNRGQFRILGLDRYIEDNPNYGHRFTVKGKETYARILIQRIK